MEHLVTFIVAEYLITKGIIIDSKYCYCRYGVRAVKSNKDGKTVAERTYNKGVIEPIDHEWEIEYPSANWIPAPNVYNVIRYLDEHLNVVIVPVYNGHRQFGYDIYFNDNKIDSSTITYHSITATYNAAINNFVLKQN